MLPFQKIDPIEAIDQRQKLKLKHLDITVVHSIDWAVLELPRFGEPPRLLLYYVKPFENVIWMSVKLNQERRAPGIGTSLYVL